jgi:hypothetical protein
MSPARHVSIESMTGWSRETTVSGEGAGAIASPTGNTINSIFLRSRVILRINYEVRQSGTGYVVLLKELDESSLPTQVRSLRSLTTETR